MDQNIDFIFRLPRGRRSKMKLKICIKQKKDDPWILVCPFDLFKDAAGADTQGAEKQV